jgi:hypothetical protein
MTVRTQLKAGGHNLNHNESLARITGRAAAGRGRR